MSNSVILTFIRHGKSTDNGTGIWAGWKDAPLSESGMDQARALGEYFADTHFTAIIASDLKRAFSTAQVLYDYQGDPKPSFDSSMLLREQNFGLAEGKRGAWALWDYPQNWTFEQCITNGVYPYCYGDDDTFPEGESIKDLAVRARVALLLFVLPHVWQAAKEGKVGQHVAIVSHGLCINELITALLTKSADYKPPENPKEKIDYSHKLPNTGWTRVVVDVKGAQEGQLMDLDKGRPALVMRVTDVASDLHLYPRKRQDE